MRIPFRFLSPTAALFLTPLACMAAGTPGHHAGAAEKPEPPVQVAVVCACEDAAGKAYAEAVRAELRHNPHFRAVSERAADQDEVGEIYIESKALAGKGGSPWEAISVVYRHDGAELHQMIETTCPTVPLTDLAAGVLVKVRELEQEREDLAREEGDSELPRMGKS